MAHYLPQGTHELPDPPTRGNPQNLTGKGRPKGKQNNRTVEIRNAISKAFDNVGGVQYLEMVAVTDPKTFCALLQRTIPQQLSATITGSLTIDLATAMLEAGNRANHAALDQRTAIEIIEAEYVDTVTEKVQHEFAGLND